MLTRRYLSSFQNYLLYLIAGQGQRGLRPDFSGTEGERDLIPDGELVAEAEFRYHFNPCCILQKYRPGAAMTMLIQVSVRSSIPSSGEREHRRERDSRKPGREHQAVGGEHRCPREGEEPERYLGREP